jgi:hypothetical protein
MLKSFRALVRWTTKSAPRRPNSPEHHADQLLHWLLEHSDSNTLLYPEVLSLYRTMVRELGWAPRSWNPIAKHLTGLLGGHKTYCWVTCVDGSRHRLRMYRLPSRPCGAPHAAFAVRTAEPQKFEEAA